ncbi:AmmeMemoRadiSam system protein B [Candidatus Woesearchaeota archaeon]|nr:AmmeMemoRadiSam system protein B [Candidatus Woesearchaeota archaeon]
MREPMYAGSFYPRSEKALVKAIEACFGGAYGPGVLPNLSKHAPKHAKTSASVEVKAVVKAVISPHAGYAYSGMAAAWSYKALAEAGLPDVFIILAPNHRGAVSGISVDTFKTPLGLVRVDQDFANLLAKKGTIPINNAVHELEHSLEVQLPFLQYVFEKQAEKIKIVPILVSSDIDLKKAAIDLKEAIIDSGKKVCFIVSSDFTHFGPNFGYLPFKDDLRNKISELDMRAVEIIKLGDADSFEEFLEATDDTICGASPITLMLRTVKFTKSTLEKYYVSGDLSGDYLNSVSYVSMSFR